MVQPSCIIHVLLCFIVGVSFSTVVVISEKEGVTKGVGDDWSGALPFTRALQLTDPPLQGEDVVILQSLLNRMHEVNLTATGLFDRETEKALWRFQYVSGLQQTGILDAQTATLVIDRLMSDGYHHTKTMPEWAKFKIQVPVHKNRSLESQGTLYGPRGEVLHRFRVRAQGGTSKTTGAQLNQLTTNGNTPTGLMSVDLNSPEPTAFQAKFSPFPVLRCVKGMAGNAAIQQKDSDRPFYGFTRYGILVHSGIWPGWTEDMPLPRSHGCLVVSLKDLTDIVIVLVQKLGVKVNKNPLSGKMPYPYPPQGVISIEEIDH